MPLLYPLSNLRHSWPHDFYHNSISDPYSLEIAHGYGFALGEEGDPPSWPPYHAVGEKTVLRSAGIDEAATVRVPCARESSTPVHLAGIPHATSDSGTVSELHDGISMMTGSPVWFVARIESLHIVDFVTLNIEFTSGPGARGILTLYLDDILLGTIDERYAGDGASEYLFPVLVNDAGAHVFALRLDPMSAVPSEVAVTHVRIGNVVPEPGTAELMRPCLLFVVVAWRYRIGRWHVHVNRT
jgi:hypothetical protein